MERVPDQRHVFAPAGDKDYWERLRREEELAIDHVKGEHDQHAMSGCLWCRAAKKPKPMHETRSPE